MTATVDGGLSRAQLDEYEATGFVRLPGFADRSVCEAMLERAVAVARGEVDRPDDVGWVLPEANLVRADRPGGGDGGDGRPEDLVSKIFRLHRDPVFREWVSSESVTALAASVVGPAVDCFLSQFIFKNPGAWGQPWHQDSHYFPFEPPRPVVGLWLAVTEATIENGCLHVLPGSHTEPVHDHVDDRRPGANYGYREIVDHDMSGAVPVLMEPGDLLVFDSHLMHRSTDNASTGIRAAMVYHCCATGTRDLGDGIVHDFMTVRS